MNRQASITVGLALSGLALWAWLKREPSEPDNDLPVAYFEGNIYALGLYAGMIEGARVWLAKCHYPEENPLFAELITETVSDRNGHYILEYSAEVESPGYIVADGRAQGFNYDAADVTLKRQGSQHVSIQLAKEDD